MAGPEAAPEEDPLVRVRRSCAWVAGQAAHVLIDEEAVRGVADRAAGGGMPLVEWDFEGIHFRDGGPLTTQYLLVVDTINFCFWPDAELQYEHIAGGLKRSLEDDPDSLNSESLARCDGPMLRALVRWPRELPLEEERADLVREVGRGLLRHFGGQAAGLVAAAGGSAAALVTLVTSHFPGFRDEATYRGRQVSLYKRAQIFVGDLFGAFGGRGLGAFRDIAQLTMFADYVVPAVLRQWGVLRYSAVLAAAIDGGFEVAAGAEEEVELRACCIVATERLRELLAARTGSEVLSIQLDWWLWKQGEATLAMRSHHKTRTIFY